MRFAQATRRQNTILIVLTVLMMAAVFTGSLLPTHYKVALHTRGRLHSWVHVLAFGALAFVAARSTRSTPARLGLFAGALTLGFAIEVLEHVAYHAALEWRDVLVDAIGISVATLCALLLD